MSTIYEPPPVNGHKSTILDLEAIDSFDYDTEQLTMPPRTKAEQDEKLAEAVEQLSILMLRMDSRLAATEGSKDKTSLPNWLMPIVCGVLLALLGFVYTTVDRRIDEAKSEAKADIEREERAHQTEVSELKIRLSTQEIFTQNTREQFIKNNWDFTESGKLVKRK